MRRGEEEVRGGKEEEKRNLEEDEEQESELKLDISKNYYSTIGMTRG